MKFIRMVAVNCKRYFKDYKNIIMMFILPFVSVALVNVLLVDGMKGTNVKVAVINTDRGNLGKQLIEDLGVTDIYDNKEKGLKELKNYNYISVYEIPENFTEVINNAAKPEINAYKLEEGNSSQIFEVNLENKLNEMLKVKVLQKSGVSVSSEEISKNYIRLQYNTKPGLLSQRSFLPIILIMFYLVTFSSTFSTDLLNLRKGKILERFLATNNKGYEIMGSIYLAMLIVQGGLYTASFVIMDLVFKYNFQNFGTLIINIILMTMVSISLVVMLSRILKEPAIANVVLTLITMIMFFVYMAGLTGETSSKVPAIIMTLSKFTPFYWALGSIEKSVLFPNAIILILMALAFFSAGSIRYSNFAKE